MKVCILNLIPPTLGTWEYHLMALIKRGQCSKISSVWFSLHYTETQIPLYIYKSGSALELFMTKIPSGVTSLSPEITILQGYKV